MTALLQNVADELLIDPPYRDQLGDGNWLIDRRAGDPESPPDRRTTTSSCSIPGSPSTGSSIVS